MTILAIVGLIFQDGYVTICKMLMNVLILQSLDGLGICDVFRFVSFLLNVTVNNCSVMS